MVEDFYVKSHTRFTISRNDQNLDEKFKKKINFICTLSIRMAPEFTSELCATSTLNLFRESWTVCIVIQMGESSEGWVGQGEI